MKKIFLLASLAGLISFSCSKKEEIVDENAARNAEMAQQNESQQVVLTPEEEGKTLIETANCLTCHKTDDKLIGPSYREVAAKYENTPENAEMLATRIIEGSTGVWGSAVMTPHSGLSKENAKKMVAYIMTLK